MNFRPTPPAIFGGCVSAFSLPPADFLLLCPYSAFCRDLLHKLCVGSFARVFLRLPFRNFSDELRTENVGACHAGDEASRTAKANGPFDGSSVDGLPPLPHEPTSSLERREAPLRQLCTGRLSPDRSHSNMTGPLTFAWCTAGRLAFLFVEC